MKLSQFKFDLPEELIAQYPNDYRYNDETKTWEKSAEHFLASRDEARLLVLHYKSGKIEHKQFTDLLDYFDNGDLFIFNDTKVFPAKLYGNKEKTGAKIEVFLLRELNPKLRLWDVLVEPARKIRVGNKLYFGEDDSMVAEVIDNTTSRGRTVRFLYDGEHDEFKKSLYALGQTPLPDTITRDPEPEDAERYQTIFANKEGAVVAPYSGLHFSQEIVKRLKIKGAKFSFLTLHSSLGMFRDIDVEDLTKHKSDSEQLIVGDEICNIFNQTQEDKHRICAVGTSVLRGLETASTANGMIKPYEGWTNKFIFPPYQFDTATHLLSNLQLPFSTMLMTQAAFGGYEQVMKVYEIAVKEKYSFGVYGDSFLLIPD